MNIKQIRDLASYHDADTNGQRVERWDVIADDGEFTIQATLAAAVQIEGVGVPIEAAQTRAVRATAAEWQRQGIGAN